MTVRALYYLDPDPYCDQFPTFLPFTYYTPPPLAYVLFLQEAKGALLQGLFLALCTKWNSPYLYIYMVYSLSLFRSLLKCQLFREALSTTAEIFTLCPLYQTILRIHFYCLHSLLEYRLHEKGTLLTAISPLLKTVSIT